MAGVPLIQVIKDTLILPRDVLYIDPNNSQITEDVTYSVQLVIDDSEIGHLEYNSIYEETFNANNSGPPIYGTNGRGQNIEEIAIQLWQRPPETFIIKPKKAKLNTTQIWKLPDEYDTDEEYSYEWEIVETQGTTIPASIVGGQYTKKVEIFIEKRGFLFLKCFIYRILIDNSLVCPRIPRIMQEVGFTTGKYVVSRNRFT